MLNKNINGKQYRLPGNLNIFQEEMYLHLINWKRKYITTEAGKYLGEDYDAILPDSFQNKYPFIYSSILEDLLEHRKKYYFKIHQHFNHMASSQAANVNLFLPILLHPKANSIFKKLKQDFDSLASDVLFKGFRIEYWDGNSADENGLLGDHSARSGTDSDIAIAYRNKDDELCLWLIEHKLTEKEFTTCGGYRSKDRNKNRHLCEKSFDEILNYKNLCYYHDVRGFNYWNITDTNKSFFVNHNRCCSCPFKGGMNQLWRNQLLGLAIEKVGTYKHVYFSVVKHPGNNSLNNTIQEYEDLTNNNPKFFAFTSLDIINSAASLKDPILNKWVEWYKELYRI